jgi:hypothetical protein
MGLLKSNTDVEYFWHCYIFKSINLQRRIKPFNVAMSLIRRKEKMNNYALEKKASNKDNVTEG